MMAGAQKDDAAAAKRRRVVAGKQPAATWVKGTIAYENEDEGEQIIYIPSLLLLT